jgi:hypothetical protein
MYIGIRVTYPVFLSDIKKIEFSQQIFEKYTNIKFNETPSSGSRGVPCGRLERRTDRQTEGQTDRRKDRNDEAKALFEILRTRLKSTDDSSIGN